MFSIYRSSSSLGDRERKSNRLRVDDDNGGRAGQLALLAQQPHHHQIRGGGGWIHFIITPDPCAANNPFSSALLSLSLSLSRINNKKRSAGPGVTLGRFGSSIINHPFFFFSILSLHLFSSEILPDPFNAIIPNYKKKNCSRKVGLHQWLAQYYSSMVPLCLRVLKDDGHFKLTQGP